MRWLKYIGTMILLAVTTMVAAQESYVVDSVCVDAERYYRVDGEPGSTYLWELTDTLGNDIAITNPAGTPFTDGSIVGSEIFITWNNTGTFNLMVTQWSDHGCDSIQVGIIKVYEQPYVEAGPDQILCPGDDVFLADAIADHYKTLAWTSTGDGSFDDPTQVNPIYTPGPSDIFTGEVTLIITAEGLSGNETCITAIDSMKVSFINMSAAATPTDVSCWGAVDGTITISDIISLSGVTEFSINGGSWSSATYYEDLPPGFYTIDMRDTIDISCIYTVDTVEIREPDILDADVYSADATCLGDDGMIYIYNPTGGSGSFGQTGDYQYSLNGFEWWYSEDTLKNILPGVYEISMRNRFDPHCTVIIDTVIIDFPDPIIADLVQTDVTCFGGQDGTITIFNPENGSGVYEYRITAEELGFSTAWVQADSVTFGNLYAGEYATFVRDFNSPECVYPLDTLTIVEPDPLSATVDWTDLTCFGSDDGTITISSPLGGSGEFIYSINGLDWGLVNTFTDLEPGLYYVYIADRNAPTCITYLGEYEIQEPLPLAATVDKTDITCYAAADGTITLSNPQNYQGAYQYRIDGVNWASTNSFVDLGPGTYVIEMQDSQGCYNILDTVDIIEPEPLTAEVDFTNATCLGADGTITISNPMNSVSGLYEFSIDEGANWSDAMFYDGLTTGTYIIKIRDAALITCEQTIDTVIITEPDPLYAEAITTDITCYGAANGILTVTYAEGSSGVFEFSINGINWTSDTLFTDLGPGTYTLYMRDAISPACETIVDDYIINEPEPLYAELETTDVTCFAYNDGTITVINASGGYGSYEYSLDGLAWDASGYFEDLYAGNYIITMRDLADTTCTFIMDTVIFEPPQIVASTNPVDVTCYGGSDGYIEIMNMLNGVAPYEFSIDGGSTWQTDSTFSNLTAGTYSIMVRDALGCTTILDDVTVGQPDPLYAEATHTNETGEGFNDGTITIFNQAGGSGDYEYSMDAINWQASPTFSNLAPGTYYVWMSDINSVNCMIEIEVIILPAGSVSADYIKEDVTCYNGNDGSIRFINPTGTVNYEYSINGGGTWQTSPIFNELIAQPYQLMIRDADNPTNETFLGNLEITQPDPINSTVTRTNETFAGANDGTITISDATGGSGFYEYSIDGVNWQSSPIFTGLPSGTYDVYTSDAAVEDCMISEQVVIQPAGSISADKSKQDILCYGDNNGIITIFNASGGSGMYEFSIDGGVTWDSVTGSTYTYTNLSPDTYDVMIRDAITPANEVHLGIVEIVEPPELVATYILNPPRCHGEPGTVTVIGRGGTGAKEGVGTFTVAAGTTFNFPVRDENGCIDYASGTMPNPPEIVVSFTRLEPLCYGDTGKVIISASGGTGDLFLNGVPITPNVPDTFNVVTGSYTYRVTDSNGCFEIINGIMPPAPPELTATTETVDGYCYGDNGTITVNVAGGTPDYQYSIDGTNYQASNVFTVPTGDYTVYVRDANGCETITEASIVTTEDIPPTVVCNDIEISLDENGHYILTDVDIEYIANGTNDNCTPFTMLDLQFTPFEFDCEDVGQTVIGTLVVTDLSGNSDTCQASVTVLDSDPPEIDCQPITLYVDENGQAGLTIDDVLTNLSDNCGIDTVFLSRTEFDCNDIASSPNMETITAIDNSGNEASCNFLVYVLDTISPVIDCIDYTIVLDETENFTLTPDLVSQNEWDNCEVDHIELSRDYFDCTDIGVNPVTVTIYDVNGNMYECVAEVTVVAGNEQPIAADDSYITTMNIDLTMPVLDNDSDPENQLDESSLTILSGPAHGTVTINSNYEIEYIPNTGYIGFDEFTYSVSDMGIPCFIQTDVATVTIEVKPPNRPPVANPDTYISGCSPITGNILDNDYDPDGDSIILNTTLIELPQLGTVTLYDNGDFAYYFERGMSGTDHFIYEICDDNEYPLCDTALVTLIIYADFDCDNIPDVDDIDDDNDGIIDVVEGDMNRDTDGDGIPDSLDIDSDNDGIPDNIEGQPEHGYIYPSGNDFNGNGLDDIYETGGSLGINPVDTDNDGAPDYVDTDSDNDNVPDNIEGFDQGAKGIAEVLPTGMDDDGDGLDNAYDNFWGGFNENDLNNPYGTEPTLQDFDGDGTRDWRDTDDDDDMILTRYEDLNNDGIYFNDDIDFDGHPEYLDYQGECDMFIPEGFSPDGDGIHDFFQIYCMDKYPDAKMMIFDTEGYMLYEKEHYGNLEYWGSFEFAWWNGETTMNHQNALHKVIPGVYMYIMDKGNGDLERGFVMVSY